ncbi:unnamed protein product [Urochloa humidicola]
MAADQIRTDETPSYDDLLVFSTPKPLWVCAAADACPCWEQPDMGEDSVEVDLLPHVGSSLTWGKIRWRWISSPSGDPVERRRGGVL